MLKIACVTGATGMIGRRIVRDLLAKQYTVRILTRRDRVDARVQVFRAGLSDVRVLDLFVAGADILFHCAAELRQPSRMWEVNVAGTKNVTAAVRAHGVRYFCHLSSAGVVGRTSEPWVDETTPCNPQDTYERSKLEAETCALQPIAGCRTVVLRPTNVVDGSHLGEVALPVAGSLTARLKAFIKGGECAHIVHADDVARAAMHFVSRSQEEDARVYFVSLDDDPMNTVAHLWPLYAAATKGVRSTSVTPLPHLPVMAPHILRRLVRQSGNPGSVRYSARRLLSEDFRFSLDVPAAVAEIVRERRSS